MPLGSRSASSPARCGSRGLGWDDDHYEVDGVQQGPYRAWQVVGCGISICVGAVAARVRAGRGAVLHRRGCVAYRQSFDEQAAGARVHDAEYDA